MMFEFVYMLILIIAITSLSLCLLLGKKDYLENYENKLRGIKEKSKTKIKYAFGAIYVVIVAFHVFVIIDSLADQVSPTMDISIQQFNYDFLRYEGENTKTEIKKLLSTVIASNSNEENIDAIITVEFGNDGEIITEENPTNYTKGWSINSKLKPNKKYNVKFEYVKKGNTKGLINKIKINEVNENG